MLTILVLHLVRFCLGTCIIKSQQKILKSLKFGFVPVHISVGGCSPLRMYTICWWYTWPCWSLLPKIHFWQFSNKEHTFFTIAWFKHFDCYWRSHHIISFFIPSSIIWMAELSVPIVLCSTGNLASRKVVINHPLHLLIHR